MRHLDPNWTPLGNATIRDKMSCGLPDTKPKTSEHKTRAMSLYEKIQSVNESDPLYMLSQGGSKKVSEQKRRMRATPMQHLVLERYSHMVNSFIQQMDSPIKRDDSGQQIRVNSRKMSILKSLLSKYNSRLLCPNNYNKLINSFGLQIQPIQGLERLKTSDGRSKVAVKLQTLMDLVKAQQGEVQQQDLAFVGQKDISYQLPYRQTYGTMTILRKDQRPQRTDNSRKGTSLSNKKYNDESKHRSFRGESEEHSFQNRLAKYREFLFVINLSNGIFRNLEVEEYKTPLKFYIGKGNNCNLIKSILKNRFWFEETSNILESNFAWTQIKVDEFFSNEDFYDGDIPFQQGDLEPQKSPTRFYKTAGMGINKKGVKLHQPDIPQLKLMTPSEYDNYQQLKRVGNHKNSFQTKSRGWRNIRTLKEDAPGKLHNHLPQNCLLGNKKAMFYCLKQYYKLCGKDVFSVVPLTFHIQNGTTDPQFRLFTEEYNRRKVSGKQNIWIIKPGEATNRGNGISCSRRIDDIRNLVSRKIKKNQQRRTFILQSYITKPFLYHKRKFDIRAYMLLTTTNGRMKGYWYQEGYVRTSSSYFNLSELDDPMIHLTNDAVQKDGDSYGRFEAGNKVTYNELQKYIESTGSKVDFFASIYPQMKKIATDSVKSTAIFLDPLRHESNFELFGLDFMIDQDFKVWLIQINTNPCLELSCGILQRLIPHLIQNLFRLAVDPLFPPPNKFPFTKRYNVLQNALHYNKFQLIFDEITQGKQLHKLYANSNLLSTIGVVKEDQDTYEDDGEMINIDQQS